MTKEEANEFLTRIAPVLKEHTFGAYQALTDAQVREAVNAGVAAEYWDIVERAAAELRQRRRDAKLAKLRVDGWVEWDKLTQAQQEEALGQCAVSLAMTGDRPQERLWKHVDGGWERHGYP